MLNLRKLFPKSYTFTEENLYKMVDEIKTELRKEIEAEFKARIQSMDHKLLQQSNYIEKLEKDYSELSIKADIEKGKAKSKDKEEEKTLIDINKYLYGSEL